VGEESCRYCRPAVKFSSSSVSSNRTCQEKVHRTEGIVVWRARQVHVKVSSNKYKYNLRGGVGL
jgi:hypothetical protein